MRKMSLFHYNASAYIQWCYIASEVTFDQPIVTAFIAPESQQKWLAQASNLFAYWFFDAITLDLSKIHVSQSKKGLTKTSEYH